MNTIRSLAAAQTVPVRGDVAANVAQHVALARLAAEARVEVVVFPELSLTGYELELADGLAFSEEDARLSPLRELATSAALNLIVGAPLRRAGQLYLAAFIIRPNGTLALHTKRHLSAFSALDHPGEILPPAESSVFTAGTGSELMRLAHHDAALAICGESLQPWAPKEARQRGASSYLTCHFALPDPDISARLSGLGRYAAHYDMALVFANYGGPTGGLAAGGSSAILSAAGQSLVQLGTSGAGVAIAREDQSGWSTQTVML
jgi:predicted amidohydrolase